MVQARCVLATRLHRNDCFATPQFVLRGKIIASSQFSPNNCFSHNFSLKFSHFSTIFKQDQQSETNDDEQEALVCAISTTCQRLVILLFAVRGTANRRKEATKMARSLT